MAQVSDKTLSGAQSGSGYAMELQGIIDAVVSTFSGDTAPTDEVLVEGLLWHDTANDRLKIRTNGNFQTLPINTATGGIVASAGQGVTGLSIANFSAGVVDTSITATDDDTTITTSKAVFDFVDGLITAEATTRATNDTAEATARADADTAEATARADEDTALGDRLTILEGDASTTDSIEFDIAAHAALTETHGIEAGSAIVGTTDTQTISNKAIIAGTNSPSTIDGTAIGGTTAAAGSFTTLSASGNTTVGGALSVAGSITGGAGDAVDRTITINPDGTGTGTVAVTGNLTVSGTTTTVNTQVQSIADKDLVLANNQTTLAGVDGAGILIGDPTQESWTYTHGKTQWETGGAAINSSNGFKVDDTVIIDGSGNWATTGGNLPADNLDGTVAQANLPDATTTIKGISSFDSDQFTVTGGAVSVDDATTTEKGLASFADTDFAVSGGSVTIKADGVDPATQIADGALPTAVTVSQDSLRDTVSVEKGGTGKNTFTVGTLLIGDDANSVKEAIVSSGLNLDSVTNELTLDASGIKLEDLSDTVVPAIGTADDGKLLKFNSSLNSGDGGWDFATATIDPSGVSGFALQSTGVVEDLDGEILVSTRGTAPGYDWTKTLSGLDSVGATGDITTTGGDITTSTGDITTGTGDIISTSGDLSIGGDAVMVKLTTTGDINSTGSLNLNSGTSDLTMNGTLAVGGETRLNGNVTLGDGAGDNITVSGSLSSNIIPATTNTHDLGSGGARFAQVHTNNLTLGGSEINLLDDDISGTAPTTDDSIASVKAVRDYVDGLDAGGSLVINEVGKIVNLSITGSFSNAGDFTITLNSTNSYVASVTGSSTANSIRDAIISAINVDMTEGFTATSGGNGLVVITGNVDEGAYSTGFTQDSPTTGFTGNFTDVSQGDSKIITSGRIAIVTISGETKLFRAKSQQSDVLKGTAFDGTGGGTNFQNSVNWEELQLGGGGTTNITNIVGGTGVLAGTQATYNLNVTPPGIENVVAFIDGVYQNRDIPNPPFTIDTSGTPATITFSETLTVGSRAQILIGEEASIGSGTFGNLTSTGVITADSFVGDGSGLTGIAGSGHDHEGIYTEPKAGTAAAEGFRFTTTDGTADSDGNFPDKALNMVYRNDSGTDVVVATITVADILSGFPVDSWTT